MLLLNIIVATTGILLGLFVLFKKRSLQNISFTLFAAASGVWILSTQSALYFENTSIGRITFFVPILILSSLCIFAYSLQKEKKPLLLANLALGTCIITLAPTSLIVQSVSIEASILTATYGPLISLHRIFILFSIISALYLIAKNIQAERCKTLWLLSSIGLFILLAMFTNMILPQFFNITSLNHLGPLFSLFMIIGITYAITKHQLMDIRIIIQRGLVYTALIVFIGITFSILLFTAEYFIGEYMQLSRTISGLSTTLLGIAIGPKLLAYLTEKTDKIFYKHPYIFRDAVSEIDLMMRSHLEREDFVYNFTALLEKIFKPEKVHFICFANQIFFNGKFTPAHKTYSPLSLAALKENTGIVRFCKSNIKKQYTSSTLYAFHCDMEIQVIVPIKQNGEVISTLCLGKRKSGDPYTKKDIKLLTIAAGYAGSALRAIQLYEQQKEYSEKLEKLVEHRTKELRTLQESQKQSMLDISHGIQNPLTLLRAELESQQLHINKGVSPAKKLLKLVDKTSTIGYELVTLARLNTIPEKISYKCIEITKILDECIKTLRQTAGHQGVTLHYAATLNTRVNGSAGDVQRLIMNLVKNAIKYTAISTNIKKEVHVTLVKSTRDNSVIITIKDSGIGIPKTAIPKLFDIFYRVSNTTPVEGTGIGLTIVKRIVNAHHGTIAVQSTPGDGSTFTVTLQAL